MPVDLAGGDLAALANGQLAVWKLEGGDQKGAMDLLDQVVRSGSPRAEAISGNIRSAIDASAPLFEKKYREALPALQVRYAQTNPSADGQIRTLLAWAYVETGEMDKAAGLVGSYPLPLSDGDSLFASLAFPRFLAVRAAVLEQRGKKDEARQSRELFAKFGGAATN